MSHEALQILSQPDSATCGKCGQEIPHRCNTCGQDKPIETTSTEGKCPECKQELEEESEADSEVNKGYDFEEKRNGTILAICRTCNRKCDECPQCKQLYYQQREDDSTDEEEEEESGEESNESSEEESKTKYGRRD